MVSQQPSSSSSPSLFIRPNMNFLMLYAESIFSLGTGILPFTTTLSDFINRYYNQGERSAWYGVFTASVIAVATIPKLLVSHRLEHMTNCRSVYMWNLHLMRLCWCVLGVVICGGFDPVLAGVLFYFVYMAYSFLQGMNDVICTHIFHAVVPSQLRGPFFGWKQTVDNVAQLLGSGLAIYILSWAPFPTNYGIACFIIFGLGVMSNAVLQGVRIPDQPRGGHHHKSTPSLWAYTSEVSSIVRRDRALRTFVLASILATTGGIIKQFFVLYVQRELGRDVFTTKHVAFAATVSSSGKIMSGLAWGYYRHAYGLKATLVLTRLVSMLPFLCMLMVSADYALSGNLFWIYVAFFLYGTTTCGYLVTKNDIYMVLGKHQSATYMSVATLLQLPFRFVMPIFVGVVVDRVGYASSFVVSLVIVGLSVIMLMRMVIVEDDASSESSVTNNNGNQGGADKESSSIKL
eukprot:PhM_4_TR1756/c0_g1_i1/m.98434